MNESLFVLGGGPFQLPAIRKGKEMGLCVVATDVNPDAPGLAEADFPYTTDLTDIEECLSIARQHQVSGVLTVASDLAVPTVAAVAHDMGLNGPGIEGATVSTNKAMMRKLFSDHNIPSTITKSCTSIEDGQTAAQELKFPVVVKPIDNAGSRGVMYVDSRHHLAVAIEHALENSRTRQALIEEFLPGVELSVEGFVCGGKFLPLALSDKRRTPLPYLMDTTVLFPSTQSIEIQATATEIVKRSVETAGIENATIHAEVMVTTDGPKMVEFAARGAGFKVFTDMLPWVTGIDVISELINISVGRTAHLVPRNNKGAVLRFLEAPPGQVKEINGDHLVKAIAGVMDFEIFVQPGDDVRPLKSGSDRIGYCITIGETRQSAETRMDQVENTIDIIVDTHKGRPNE